MISLVATLSLLTLPAAPAVADCRSGPQDSPTAPAAEQTADDPDAEYQALVDHYDEAMNEFYEVYGAAESDEERGKIFQTRPDPATFAEGFWKHAERHAGTDHAAKALAWIVEHLQGEDRAKPLAVLLADHIESEELGRVCQALRYERDPAATEAVRAVLEGTPRHSVQGQACFTLAFHLKNQAGRASGEEREILLGESEELFQRVKAEFGDLPSFRGTLADAAEGELFELQNLQIGMVAPDIEGEDLDGVKFRLSDYRGKVVVLDFWGHW